MGLYEFTRQKRLLTPGDFRKVFDGKTVRAGSPELLFIALPTSGPESRIGFILAKKHIKRAVKRNRIKRICREHFRQHQHNYKHKDIIVLARKGADQLDSNELHRLATKMLVKLDSRLNDRFSSQ